MPPLSSAADGLVSTFLQLLVCLLLGGALRHVVLVNGSIDGEAGDCHQHDDDGDDHCADDGLLLALLGRLLRLLLRRLLFGGATACPGVALRVLILLCHSYPFPAGLLPIVVEGFAFPAAGCAVCRMMERDNGYKPGIAVARHAAGMGMLCDVGGQRPPVDALSETEQRAR